MAKATYQGVVIAESETYETVEGNVYFPPQSLKTEHFRATATHTVCSWKGDCSYFDIVVGDNVNRDAAWYYPEPKPAANNIKGFVAFWRGVEIER